MSIKYNLYLLLSLKKIEYFIKNDILQACTFIFYSNCEMKACMTAELRL